MDLISVTCLGKSLQIKLVTHTGFEPVLLP